jgi:hypothetical protein
MSPADRSCILRYASGIALSAVLAFGIDWPLSFLATLLTAAFLGNRNPRPNLKATLGIIIAIAVIFAVGSAATLYLYPYPAVFLLLFCWCLYLTFYAAARGTSGFIILLYTLALLLLPLIGGPTPYMAVLVSVGLLKSAAAALVCVHIAHTLFPGGTFAVEQMPLQTTPREASHAAWLSTAVILPFALVCLVFNLSGAVLPVFSTAYGDSEPGVPGDRILSAGVIIRAADFQRQTHGTAVRIGIQYRPGADRDRHQRLRRPGRRQVFRAHRATAGGRKLPDPGPVRFTKHQCA